MALDLETTINVKDLLLDEPAKEDSAFFVAERDITPQDWQGMLSELKSTGVDPHNLDERFKSATGLAESMVLLFPSRKEELEVDYLEDLLALKVQLSAKNRPGGLHDLILFASRLKVLAPEQFRKFDPFQNRWDSLFHDLMEELGNRTNRQGGYGFAFLEVDHVARSKMVLPDEFNDGDPQLDFYSKLIWVSLNLPQNIDKSLIAMANMRIIWPEKFDRFGFTSEVQAMYRKEFESQIQKARVGSLNWNEVAYTARCMQILSAEEILIDRKEVKIILPHSAQSMIQEESIPETRRF